MRSATAACRRGVAPEQAILDACIIRFRPIMWDGAQWMPLGPGTSGTVRALTVWNNTLVAGGDFYTAGGLVSPGMAFWGCPSLPCYPNCDNSTTAPVLTISDFACFLNRFFAGDTWANCDNSTAAPVLNVSDFACFLNRFASGCR